MGILAGNSFQGSGAVALGYGTGQKDQGEYSIAIGYGAGNISQGINSIAIGYNSGKTSFPANAILLNASGTDIVPAVSVAGFHVNPVRNPAPTANALYYNTSTKEITYGTSSATTKNSIMPLEEDTGVVYELQPRSFLYNSDPASGRQIGYIAEEAASIHQRFAGYNEPGGAPVGIDYNCITVFLLEELRKLKERLDILEQKK